MINLSQFPFVRIILPFASGIIVFLNLESPSPWMVFFLVPLVSLYMAMVMVFNRNLSFRFRWLPGFLIHLVLFFLGYQLAVDRFSFRTAGDLVALGRARYMVVELTEFPSERQNSFRAACRLIAFHDSTSWNRWNEKIMIYFEKSEAMDALRFGDRLFILTGLQEVGPPRNPGEFDHRRYLKYTGIRRQAWVRHDQWEKTGSGGGSMIVAQSMEARNKLLNILQSEGIEGKDLALASAILLGYDEFLDPEQKRQFSGAGAMHILCVSGLHVGIVAMVLNSLFFFLNRNPYLKLLKLVLLLLLIWAYAAITGFSPSVLRAATMFSFVFAGKSFRRKASIYNMLASSAFLLLVMDPFMITRVGFQLSYLAVAGIVLLHRPVSSLVYLRHSLPWKIWELTVVSLTATVATFPLSLYYFHQFPNLFLVTNLVAIPASFLILYNGILLLALSFIPVVATVAAYTLGLILSSLNAVVGALEGLPFSTTKNVFLTLPELLLLAALLISMVSLFLLKHKRYLYGTLVTGILFTALLVWRNYSSLNQSLLVFYSIKGHTAFELILGRKSVFVCDSALLMSPSKIDYAVAGNRLQHGVRETRTLTLDEPEVETIGFRRNGNFFLLSHRRLVLVDESPGMAAGANPFMADYLLVAKRPAPDPLVLGEAFQFETVILDASLPPWETAKWRSHCEGSGWNFHDLVAGGGLVVDLEKE